MTLLTHYDAAVNRGDIEYSPSQRLVVEALNTIVDALTDASRAWFYPWRKKHVQGLYVYGPVGVGKTYVMDLFYQHVAEPRKARFHFHHFMKQVDSELRRLQGVRDPVRRIAQSLAKSYRVLCLDEFLVHDVADALILADLLQGLLARGVVLVATANTRPDDLYLHGVRRECFLPAIALIKRDCRVLTLDDQCDHRLGRLAQFDAYLSPLTQTAYETLVRQFDALTTTVSEGSTLTVQKRAIACVKVGVRVVWFAFDAICMMPRSQLDYLEIAERFDTVFVSDIPVIHPDDTVRALLLIHFIDVMYDQGIRLIVSAAAPAADLYVAGPMSTPFKRTLSRLQEMQSVEYQQRHRREPQFD